MTYLMLFKYTQKGLENIRESPKRVESAKQVIKAVGGEVKAFYLLMGEYDTAMLVDAPNPEAIAKASLSVGSRGNVTCKTLAAFNEGEFNKMISALP
ncbi:MAG: GYD domain-containing protein [Deltaproteobacteria bacterium]|nr:GYD domain-containing protein [Deltaproteobacteria bacterium]